MKCVSECHQNCANLRWRRRIYAKIAGSFASAGVIIVDRIQSPELVHEFSGPGIVGSLAERACRCAGAVRAAVVLLSGRRGARGVHAVGGQREAPANPAAWLFTVVRNGAISAGRAESRRRKHEASAAHQAADWFEANEGDSIDTQVAANGLNRLPLEEREVIVAHVWGGLTFAEIAEIVGSSTSAIHRRYQSGLQALRNLLGEKCLPTTDSTKHCRKS